VKVFKALIKMILFFASSSVFSLHPNAESPDVDLDPDSESRELF